MPKFILIDHSIRSYGGHYFEYAVHVLHAAAAAGYKPILAVNREYKLDPSVTPEFEVHPLYKYDFWGWSGGTGDRYQTIQSALNKLQRLWFSLLFTQRFSILGPLRMLAYHPREILASRRELVPYLILLSPVLVFYRIAAAAKHALLPRRKREPGVPTVPLHPLSPGSSGVYSASRSSILIRGYRFLTSSLFHNRTRANSFKETTADFLRKVAPSANDLVFVPSISEIDLVGLAKLLKSSQESRVPSWHLVFRRNIYSGREPDYVKGSRVARRVQRALRELKSARDMCRVFLYTDTDQLSIQYNTLGVSRFHTLPIPVNPELRKPCVDSLHHRESARPLTATYVGDARDEKGYQHLPSVVEQVRDDYIDTGRLRFLLQSNFAFRDPRGQAGVVFARDQLEGLPGVTLLKHPIASDEYAEIISRSDIGLLFYDRLNYYARSSGTLVEFLMAGKPVIVPASTWLSRQIESRNSQHANQVIEAARLVKSLVYDVARVPSRWVTETPVGSTNLAIRLDFGDNPMGTYVSVRVEQRDRYGRIVLTQTQEVACQKSEAICLFKVDSHCRSVVATLGNAHAEALVELGSLEMRFVDAGQPAPLGAVGLAYVDVEEIPFLLADIIDHYEHYLNEAAEFAAVWRQEHSAERLVDMLVVGTHG